MNSVAIPLLSDAFVKYLRRTTSDHAPMLVSSKSNGFRYGPSTFKFQQMLVTHEDFLNIVQETCRDSSMGPSLFGLAAKLKRLK